MKKILLFVSLITLSGCYNLSIFLTPEPVKDSVLRSTLIAKESVENPPKGEDLQSYLKTNYESWKLLMEWYNIDMPE